MKQVGRYQIKQQLGSGAAADVFLAFDPEIKRTLAIKRLKQKHLADQEYVARFLQESKAAGVLSHPNIVTIYDVGQSDANPYIIMEYVDGDPLDDVIAQSGPFSLRATLSIGAQIADALDYAHSVGVVHRDIKPSNLLVLKNSETVKIADFGIARLDSSDDLEDTRAGAMLGTPQYMSPEQVIGLPVDGRSDLFSLGAVLYLMVTGEKPFQAATIGQLMVDITQSKPRPIKDFCANVPQGVQSIIQKLLTREPEKRYQSGAALKADLLEQMQALAEFERTARERSPRSIRNRLTANMALLAAAVTITFGLYLHGHQSEVLTDLAIDAGASMTKLAASEIAEPIVTGDIGRIDVTIKSITQEQSFVYLHVADRDGAIIASNASGWVGLPLSTLPSFGPDDDRMNVVHEDEFDNQSIFKFVAPIEYAETRVGTIELGLSRSNLESALTISLYMLSIVALITIVLVSCSAYFLIGVVSNPILKVQAALKGLSMGSLTERISHKRNDQVGELYDAFNALAEQIVAIRPQHVPDVRPDISETAIFAETDTQISASAAGVKDASATLPFASEPDASEPLGPSPAHPNIKDADDTACVSAVEDKTPSGSASSKRANKPVAKKANGKTPRRAAS